MLKAISGCALSDKDIDHNSKKGVLNAFYLFIGHIHFECLKHVSDEPVVMCMRFSWFCILSIPVCALYVCLPVRVCACLFKISGLNPPDSHPLYLLLFYFIFMVWSLFSILFFTFSGIVYILKSCNLTLVIEVWMRKKCWKKHPLYDFNWWCNQLILPANNSISMRLTCVCVCVCWFSYCGSFFKFQTVRIRLEQSRKHSECVGIACRRHVLYFETILPPQSNTKPIL